MDSKDFEADVNAAVAEGQKKVTRRRFLKWGLGGTAAVAATAAVAKVAAQPVLSALGSLANTVDLSQRNFTEDQREARRILLNIIEQGQEIPNYSLQVTNPKGAEIKERPRSSANYLIKSLGTLSSGATIPTAIEWEGSGETGPADQKEKWFAFFNPLEDKPAQQGQVAFSFSGNFEATSKEVPTKSPS